MRRSLHGKHFSLTVTILIIQCSKGVECNLHTAFLKLTIEYLLGRYGCHQSSDTLLAINNDFLSR